MAPLVSIGLSVFNGEHSIVDAIKSVYAQTYQNWELIIIDDGSTDGSYNVISKIEDPRIKVVSDGENRGLSYRLNQIAALANGKYIARMDADDMMHPSRIEKQVSFIEKTGADLVDTAIAVINEKNKITGIRGLCSLPMQYAEMLKANRINHPTVLAKKDWYASNQYDARYKRAEDFELWCRTFEKSNFERIQEPLLFYREGKVSIRNYIATSQTNIKIYKRYAKAYLHIPQYWMLILKTLLKLAIFIPVSTFHGQEYLTRLRSTAIGKFPSSISEALLAEIMQIQKTVLPYQANACKKQVLK